MSDDIVEAIDNALDDWDVSPDAVRWTPEKAPEVALRSGPHLHFEVATARLVYAACDPCRASGGGQR